MKPALNFLYLALVLLFMLGCNKEKNTYNVYVYTTKKVEYTTLHLTLNDKDKGEIPFVNRQISFDDDSLISRTLNLQLATDTYPFAVKDQYGNVKVDAQLKLKRNSVSSTDVVGEIHTSTKDHKLLIEVRYN
ncbi:MAG: hypothetical protein JWO32_395 [Bacteroidetes bacterium]|nr:hypothetical protein [Bacteroidota bacterium]